MARFFSESTPQTQEFERICFALTHLRLHLTIMTGGGGTSFIAASFGGTQNVRCRRVLCTRRRSGTQKKSVQNVRCSSIEDNNKNIDPEEEILRMGQEREMARMRERLAGLFGTESTSLGRFRGDVFDGESLREVIRQKWGRTFDVQPAKRNNRVYLQIMWRFFEQQSFYLDEEGFANHCEAVAQLLNEWDAVDFVCDYIANIKKRPVVGICLNIPIPNVTAEEANF